MLIKATGFNQDLGLDPTSGSSQSNAPLGQALPENPVIGVVDGKFEDGYFVTVTIGTNKLKGVLFHASQQNNAVQVQPVIPATNNNSGTRVIRRRRRRKKLITRDPTHPKPNRSGYNFFFAEQHAKLKLLHPGKDREISRMIGDLWNNLTETERAVYQEIGLKDKQRYQSEMAEYKEKQRTNVVLTDVMPIQQIPVEPSIEMQNVNFKETDDADKLSEDGIDTIEEQSDEESELQVSPEAGAAATEFDMAAGPVAFENDIEMANKTSIPSSSDDDDKPERTADTSPTKQATESPKN